MDLDKMVKDANKRLTKQLNTDVDKHKKEIAIAFEEAAKRLGVLKEYKEIKAEWI